MIFERREKKKYLTLLTFSINNHQKHQPHQIQSDVREWIPRNTTQHQRDTFVCWRAVISSRWLHIRAKAYARHLTTIQIKDSYAQKLYKIYPIKKDRWILISWWKKKKKMKSGFTEGVLCRDAGRSPLANIDQDQYIYFVHTRALCRRFSTLLQHGFGHVTTKQVYTPLWGDQDTWKHVVNVWYSVSSTRERYLF